MNKKKWISLSAGLVLLALGVIVTLVTRSGALAALSMASITSSMVITFVTDAGASASWEFAS